MKEAAKYFEGEHDVKAFKSSGTSGKNSVRTIYKAEVRKKKNQHNNRVNWKWLLVQAFGRE